MMSLLTVAHWPCAARAPGEAARARATAARRARSFLALEGVMGAVGISKLLRKLRGRAARWWCRGPKLALG